MKQEKWDELHKELDDALESGFDTAKVALRKYLLDNKEKVAADLEEMREKSNHTLDTIEEVAANLADPNICKTDNWIAGAKWQQERTYKLVHEAISGVLEKEKELTPIEWLVEYIHSDEYQRAFGPTYISPEIWMKAVAMQNERDERLRDFDTWKEWKTSNNF
jgi:hypothetical protein